jgi:type III secretory pathway component EscV
MTATSEQAPLAVTVTLGPALYDQLGQDATALADQVSGALADLTVALGLTNGCTAHIAPGAASTQAGTDPGDVTQTTIGVLADSVPLLYPELALWQAVAYVRSTVTVSLDPRQLTAEIARLSGEELAEVVTLVCHEAVARNTALLAANLTEALPTGEPIVELCLTPEQLQLILDGDPEGKAFVDVRDLLREEAGLPLPVVRLRLDESLRPNAYAFRLSGVRSMPRIGLTADQVLVWKSVDSLKLCGIDAMPTASLGISAAIVARDYRDKLADLGLTAQQAHEHLLSELGGTVRERAAEFVTGAWAERLMDEMGAVYPLLRQFVTDRVPTPLLVIALRDLVADQVPIKDLRRIAELCLRYASVAAAEPAAFVNSVRAGLAEVIARRASQGSGTLVAWLLDDELERALASLDPDRPAEADLPVQVLLCAALRAELAKLPPLVAPPVLLASSDARSAARRLLRARFPQVSVVSYAEIPEHVNIQPVARLSVPEPEPAR